MTLSSPKGSTTSSTVLS
jgi:hypothetical protein